MSVSVKSLGLELDPLGFESVAYPTGACRRRDCFRLVRRFCMGCILAIGGRLTSSVSSFCTSSVDASSGEVWPDPCADLSPVLPPLFMRLGGVRSSAPTRWVFGGHVSMGTSMDSKLATSLESAFRVCIDRGVWGEEVLAEVALGASGCRTPSVSRLWTDLLGEKRDQKRVLRLMFVQGAWHRKSGHSSTYFLATRGCCTIESFVKLDQIFVTW